MCLALLSLTFTITTYCSTCTANVTNTWTTGCFFAAITKLPFLHYHDLTLKKTYAAVRVSVCLYLYVYLYVGHACLICCCACALYMFHRGRVGNVLSIPLYVLTCKVIDNEATLTLTHL